MSPSRPPPAAYADDNARWQAVQARDPQADGHFVYAVRTTGVYARPSASTRLPNRENVEFFDSPQAAETAGYRPSRRLRGDRTMLAADYAALVAQACRLIASSETPLTLRALAAHAGLSPHHFHRIFKAQTGLTPKAYTAAWRARKIRQSLTQHRRTVTDAIHDAGFNASSRFYETSSQTLGMQPRRYRAGGVGAVIRFAVGHSSLGDVLVAQSQQGICAILLGDDADSLVRDLQDRFPNAELVGSEADFERVVSQVIGFVEHPGVGLDLPLDLRGTAFQLRVWQALRRVPPGTTTDYAAIAASIGAPQAARAVGRAIGANPIAVAVPCHRIIRRDGNLSGYRWGVARKQELLRREAQANDASTTQAPQAEPEGNT